MPSNKTKHIGKVFVPRSKISKKYKRSSISLLRWAEQGKIEHIITRTGRYTYKIHQLEQMLGKDG
jgi:predicted site-specific integrase-resolvase